MYTNFVTTSRNVNVQKIQEKLEHLVEKENILEDIDN